MYEIGEQVVYGSHGVCRISGTEERMVDRRRCTYLVLEPMNGSSARYYIPVGNEAALAKLSALMTREEVEALLSSEQVRTVQWIPDESRRKQLYRQLLGSGDRVRLTQAVYALYRHRERQQAAGRKVHICDENFLHDAERILAGEIAIVLELDNASAKEYLQEKLSV